MSIFFTDTLGPKDNTAFPSHDAINTFLTFSHLHIWLFSNTEVFEDDIEDLLCSNAPSDPAEAGESQPETFGCQSKVAISIPVVLSQGSHALLQVGPVAGLGQGGVTS